MSTDTLYTSSFARRLVLAESCQDLQKSHRVWFPFRWMVRENPPGRWRPPRPMLRSQPVLADHPGRHYSSPRILRTTQIAAQHMKNPNTPPLASIATVAIKRNRKATALTSRPRAHLLSFRYWVLAVVPGGPNGDPPLRNSPDVPSLPECPQPLTDGRRGNAQLRGDRRLPVARELHLDDPAVSLVAFVEEGR